MAKKATGNQVEREAVKRYLQQYYMAKQKKRILEERHRTLSAELRGPTTAPAFRTMLSNRGGGGADPETADGNGQGGPECHGPNRPAAHRVHGKDRGGNAPHRRETLGTDRQGGIFEPDSGF